MIEPERSLDQTLVNILGVLHDPDLTTDRELGIQHGSDVKIEKPDGK